MQSDSLTQLKKKPPPYSVWRPNFIEALRQTGNVSAAARAAGISRKTVYRYREKSLNTKTQKFALEWEDALEEACDLLEEEARRRAYEGVDHPVIYQGEITDTYKEYSDTLLIFLLKAHRPEKFRERYDVTSAGEKIGGYTADELAQAQRELAAFEDDISEE